MKYCFLLFSSYHYWGFLGWGWGGGGVDFLNFTQYLPTSFATYRTMAEVCARSFPLTCKNGIWPKGVSMRGGIKCGR